jgi:hypothetical protein
VQLINNSEVFNHAQNRKLIVLIGGENAFLINKTVENLNGFQSLKSGALFGRVNHILHTIEGTFKILNL